MLGDAQRPLHYLAIPPSVFPGRRLAPGADAGRRRGARRGREAVRPRSRLRAAVERHAAKRFRSRASFASTITSARSRCRTCCTSASPTPFSSRSGIATSSTACRSRWRRSSAWHGRGKFYEEVGAIRDVVQNHLLEVVTLLRMEPPVNAGRRGAAGREGEGAEGHPAARAARTSCAVSSRVTGRKRVSRRFAVSRPTRRCACEIDSWRWSGVPFYLRAGKALPVTATEVVVDLRPPPAQVFGELGPEQPNYLRFRLGPETASPWVRMPSEPGPAMQGRDVELFVDQQQGDERTPTSGSSARRSSAIPRCSHGRMRSRPPGGRGPHPQSRHGAARVRPGHVGTAAGGRPDRGPLQLAQPGGRRAQLDALVRNVAPQRVRSLRFASPGVTAKIEPSAAIQICTFAQPATARRAIRSESGRGTARRWRVSRRRPPEKSLSDPRQHLGRHADALHPVGPLHRERRAREPVRAVPERKMMPCGHPRRVPAVQG